MTRNKLINVKLGLGMTGSWDTIINYIEKFVYLLVCLIYSRG